MMRASGPASASAMRLKASAMRLKASAVGWLFVILAVLMIAVFYFYPMIQALILSFQTGTGSNLSFNGLGNYKRLFTDSMFITAVKNTFIYLIVQVPLMVLLALFISVLLNDRHLKWKGFSGRRFSCPASPRWWRIRLFSNICLRTADWLIRC
ncbi:hypothetical protein HMSSN036_76100 [Paenibacillus macerans]|nr:hypothetical protein HMSSN036_76100 [Paenibacillus macerans]